MTLLSRLLRGITLYRHALGSRLFLPKAYIRPMLWSRLSYAPLHWTRSIFQWNRIPFLQISAVKTVSGRMAVLTSSHGWNTFQFGGQRSYATLVDNHESDFIIEINLLNSQNSNSDKPTQIKPEWEAPIKDPFYPGHQSKSGSFLFNTNSENEVEFLRLSFELPASVVEYEDELYEQPLNMDFLELLLEPDVDVPAGFSETLRLLWCCMTHGQKFIYIQKVDDDWRGFIDLNALANVHDVRKWLKSVGFDPDNMAATIDYIQDPLEDPLEEDNDHVEGQKYLELLHEALINRK